MYTGILIVLAILILLVAFRFFKGTPNSTYRNDDANYLPGNTDNENIDVVDADDAGDSSDSGGDQGGDSAEATIERYKFMRGI